MAPLPPESTARYFFDYTSVFEDHTFVVRHNGIISPASAGASVATFLGALASIFFPITITTVRSAASGSTISFPVTTGIEGTSYGSGIATSNDAPRELNFIGRSSGGRRVRLGLFGYKDAISDYRVTTGESTPVNNAVNHLNASVGLFLAIDGVEPTWYPYANMLYNAYWQRAIRT